MTERNEGETRVVLRVACFEGDFDRLLLAFDLDFCDPVFILVGVEGYWCVWKVDSNCGYLRFHYSCRFTRSTTSCCGTINGFLLRPNSACPMVARA